ncbi:MAG: hypothetical protein JWN93_838 [Hyphomicrobiales bacterium]|nr:hypothetical protein [Hyphomicrobiales bacterium]
MWLLRLGPGCALRAPRESGALFRTASTGRRTAVRDASLDRPRPAYAMRTFISPIFSIHACMVSPDLIWPTPSGVPVMITSPGCIV